MGNIGYVEAKNEILERFASRDKRIIFWYDQEGKFLDDIEDDDFAEVKLVIYKKNEFEIKYLIEVIDIKSKFLIYIPTERPNDKENWLLDVLLYSDEYYADDVALSMRSLNLVNPYLRTVVSNHLKFFKSNERINSLSKMVQLNDKMTNQELMLGMCAVIVKSKFPRIPDILKELIFDLEKSEKYSSLIGFGFEDFIWNSIGEFTNYSGELSISSLTKNFLMTAVAETTQIQDFSSFFSQYIDKTKKTTNDALRLLDDLKLDSRYEDLQDFVGNSLRLPDLVKNRGLDTLEGSDVFKYFDNFIVESIFNSLDNGSLDYDFFEKIINSNRSNSIWFKIYEHEYNLILSIIAFNRAIDIPYFENETPNEYIKLYTEKLYKVDQTYRHCVTLFKKVESNDKIDKIFEKINLKYENGFLRKLGSNFFNGLSKMDAWRFSQNTLNHFYNEVIRPISYKKMFVIISDALRYEAAVELNEEINRDPGLKGKSVIESIISPIPSITKFGMASLLPNQILTYTKDDILVDQKSSQGVEKRDKILKSKNSSFAAISYSNINDFSRNELRDFMKDKTLVYIFHDEIDATGEKLENKVFEATESTIQSLLTLIKKLYNNLQISNFVVTADHGYIYRHTKINESQKYDGITKLNFVETSKRYAITNDKTFIENTLSFSLDYLDEVNNHRVILPYGYDIFKTQGGGAQYLHGGASLQEIVVPVIKISELRSSAIKENTGPVEVRIKSINRLITRRDFTVDFEQTEKVAEKKVARELISYMVDEGNNEVSGKVKFLANSESDDLSQRVTRVRFNLNNLTFDKNKRYFLVLKDSDGEILREQFTIDILGFKPII
jgi:uncharacterized protein (TIGR02687 family)